MQTHSSTYKQTAVHIYSSLGLGIIDVDPYSLYMDVDPDPAFLRSLGLKMAHFEEEKRQIGFYSCFIFIIFK